MSGTPSLFFKKCLLKDRPRLQERSSIFYSETATAFLSFSDLLRHPRKSTPGTKPMQK